MDRYIQVVVGEYVSLCIIWIYECTSMCIYACGYVGEYIRCGLIYLSRTLTHFQVAVDEYIYIYM